MKQLLRFLTILVFLAIILVNPTSAQQKPTPDQFENPEEALLGEREKAHTNLVSMIAYLDTVSSEVKNFSVLGGEKKSTILNEINTRKSWLETKKNEIDVRTYPDAEEELDRVRELVSEIESYWDSVYVRAVYWSGQLLQSKVDSVYSRLSNIINGLETEMGKPDKDTSAAESSLSIAKGKLLDLGSKKSQSKQKFEDISEKSTCWVYFFQGKQYVREAKDICEEIIVELENSIYYLEN